MSATNNGHLALWSELGGIMRPLALTLRGFAGILAGLGRDELTVDLARTVGDAELVAIAGPNGRGKTTIIDNLHPFPVMPSRAGADGLGAFSYYDHLCLPEGLKDLMWEHEGVRYRSQWVFRLNGKRRTESFLHVHRGDGWVPVQLLDGTVSDGKADTYLRCVEGILGSAETFFTSAFSAQNRRPLASYRNAEIKTLLADLLGLDQIREIGSRASETVRLIKNGLVMLRQQRADLQSESDTLAAKLHAAGDVLAHVESAAAARSACQLTLDEAKAEVGMHVVARDAAAQVEARREELTAERTAVVTGGKTALAVLEEQDRREQARCQSLEARISRRHEENRQKRARLTAQHQSHEASLRLATAIAVAARQLGRADQIVARRETMVDGCRGDVERLQALKADQARRLDRISALEREAGQAALKAEDLARRFGLTREVPCSGTAFQGRCQLLSDARDAKPLMPSATLTVVRLRTERGQVETELDTLVAEIKTLDSLPERLAMAERKLRRSRGRLARLSQLAARQDELRQSQEALGCIAAELDRLAAEPQETVEERAAREDIAAARSAIQARRQEEAARYRMLLDRIDATLASLPARFDDHRQHAAERAVETARSALEDADRAHLQAVREQQSLEEAKRRQEVVTTELGALDMRLRHVEAALGTWTLFARCMSNDGIIALSIDDAGPTLTGLANDLLLACYGPRFTVSIKTQVETAKGEAREGFDIVVHDADSGGCKSVALMSGGERVYINECLTRAIALYLAQNSGRRYETLFSDETDGALDPERKRMFIAMKREVLRLGGYRQEFFVSQTPELVALADAVIDLEALMVA